MNTYHGEFIQVEGKAEDDSFRGMNIADVLRMVRAMRPGDTLVINCTD